MHKKFIIILAILVVVLVVGAGIMAAVYFSLPGQNLDNNLNQLSASNKNTSNANIVVNTNSGLNLNITNSNQPSAETNKNINLESSTTETAAKSLARSFIERFGSFSNQNHYENLLNLKVFMTNKMQKWAEDFIKENESQSSPNQAYYGVVTSVVSIKTLSFESNQAKFLASCQRRETKASEKEANVYFQEIEIVLKAESGVWKVDSASWK